MLMKPTSSMSGVTYGPGPGEANPRAVGARLREDAAPHVLRQVVADRELGPHDAVGLRVAAALEVAGLPQAADLRGERVDDVLEVLLLVRLDALLGQSRGRRPAPSGASS